MSAQRQISETDKQAMIERQGLRCFIDNHPVASETELVFDHIEPYSVGGATEVGNIGAVCAKHNREKGAFSLSQFRDKLAMRRFFEGASKRRLDDLLQERLGANGYAKTLSHDIEPAGSRWWEAECCSSAGPGRTPRAWSSCAGSATVLRGDR